MLEDSPYRILIDSNYLVIANTDIFLLISTIYAAKCREKPDPFLAHGR
jgi:hypothetical protein